MVGFLNDHVKNCRKNVNMGQRCHSTHTDLKAIHQHFNAGNKSPKKLPNIKLRNTECKTPRLFLPSISVDDEIVANEYVFYVEGEKV